MKTTKEFLSYLRNQDINIWMEGDRLRINAPEGILTPELRAQLAKRKTEILTFLRSLPSGPSIEPIQPVPRDRDLPLSFAQERIWFLSQMEGQSVAYNVPVALRLSGSLHLEALEQSFNEIIRRHEVLRTTFATVDGKLVQVIAPKLDICISATDLRQRSKSEQEAEVQQLALEEARCPFDLSQGPLFRTTLLHLEEEEYFILTTFHHIIFDGWSTAVFVRELVTLYKASLAGKPSPLPELPIQYADFAHWQREWLQGEMLEQQLSYWKQQLLGDLPILELSTDRPRPSRLTFRGKTQSFALSEKLSKALKTLSHQEGTTLFTTLLAAFNILLHRYTGQEDILVGSPIANRNQAEIENLIGFFVNTLILRTDLSGNPSVCELLRRVHEVTLGSHAHQDLPFEHLVAEIRAHRELSRHPLFQVMFAFQNVPTQVLKLPGLTLTPIELHNKTAKFDLTLEMRETEQGLNGLWEYNTDLFEDTTITRMTEHFQTLLEGITANPEQQLSELPILTEAERHQILVEWHDSKTSYPKDTCIHDLFEAQVERTPDVVAVVLGEKQLTYRTLNQRANQLAHYIRKLGVKSDVLVGMYMERSLEMIIGILAILKAGGAYVPMDLAYPEDRIAFMLEDCQAPILLTQHQLAENLPKSKTQVICVDKDWETIAQESEENPVSGVAPDNVIYVIYTSGSTGKPKGVLVTHYNVDRLFKATQQWYHFDEQDVWTLFHSYAFDFSVWEMWGALLYGGRLVVIPYDVSRSPEEFYALLCKEQVTVLNQTPSAFRQLIRVEDTLGVADSLALRLVIFGGETLELQSLKPWFERHGDNSPQLVNMYGITETTVHVTYRLLTMADVDRAHGSVIGFPIPDLHVYILDQYAQPVPIGIPGEMYIGGAGVSRGYLNRDELTSERFLPNPFGSKSASRLYRTGDLARYLPDGDIEYLGRIDFQVQVRGFRVELGEIESILASHPAVREVVLIAREEQSREMRLIAYLVPKQEQNPTITELRAFLKEKLPEYMVPSAFVMLEAFPLTPNGKINRRALPAPEGLRPELETAYVMPQTETEQVLAKLWREILQVDKVGIYDNFFDLGGHSLLAVQLHSKVQEKFGQEISLIDLFQYSTIHALAQRIHPDQQGKPSIESGQDRAKRRLARETSMQQAHQRRQRHRTPKHQRGESHE